jgi:uncharacterized repeat protein (TIGR01451 family)
MKSTSILFLILLGLSQVLNAQQVTLDKGVDLTTALSGQIIKYTLDFGCSSLTTDCVGAVLIDSLPPEVEFLSATSAIIESESGIMVIVPIYDAVTGTVTWDFTVLSEGGLPDGGSGSVDILVRIKPGVVQNNVALTNTATIPSVNAGTVTDGATTTTTGILPMWTVTKIVTSGPIYHDRPVHYKISVCPDSPLGNLNLIAATVTDPLPPGAVFLSATNGGTYTSGSPGTVTWTLADTLKVTDPCREMSVTVIYPSSDTIENNTGLTTSIPKLNEATLQATAVGGASVTEVGSTSQALLPPFFDLNVNKYASGAGTMQDGTTGRYTIEPNNNSTVPVNEFVITDYFPDAFDLTELRIRPFDTLIPLNILVELNHSGTFFCWQMNVNPTMSQTINVSSIIGWVPGVSFVSGVKFNFGTVPAGFGLSETGAQKGSFGFVFTPSTPINNVGDSTPYLVPIQNNVTISGVRQIDNMTISEMDSATMCIVPTNLGILMPAKSVLPYYVTPVEGDSTEGNAYFRGSRVRYALVVENDGIDADADGDGFDPVSNITIVNPIASDLLPPDMTYEAGSWQITANTTGLTFDNSGTNPVFETVPNFNGTGKTLLRWLFTGDFEPSEYVTISFNATINMSVAAGTVVTNNFAMSTQSEFSCGGADCAQMTTGLNDYFGTVADPAVLLPNIDQLCLTSVALIVADTITIPIPSKSVTSSGPYAPTDSDPVELGLATDTVSYTIGLCNQDVANLELKNPVLLDLLPIQLTFVPGSVGLVSNTTGLTLDGTNPVLEVINDFAGTGRTLLRWKFTGAFPINKCVNYSFKATIKPGSGGTVVNEPFAVGNERQYTCAFGSVVDTDDMDGDGNIGETLCRSAVTADFLIPEIKGMQAKKYVKGSKNPEYLSSTKTSLGVGCTLPGDSTLFRLRVSNPGNVTLTDAIVVDVLPYINDVGVQLNTTTRGTQWTPYLVAPIVPPKPTIKVWYSLSTNPCRPEINPASAAGCVDDWTETPPSTISTVKAVKFTFLDEDIEPAEVFWFDIMMLAPDSLTLGGPGIAWNSLARDAVEILAQEPNKVGIVIQGYDLALRKQLASGQLAEVSNGEDVNFMMTIINQSTDTVQKIAITDYIPAGLTLNDPDWTDLGGGKASIILPGLLAHNDSINVNITLKVDMTNMVGANLDNYAEISAFEDESGAQPNDWDSYPDQDPVNDSGGGIATPADNFIEGNGRGAPGDGVAATDQDDHDGARVTVCPRFTQYIALDQYVCTDDLTELNDIVVPTTAAATDAVKFVYFTSQQVAPNMYTGGTDILTVLPLGGNVTLPKANIPTNVGSYWIYSILASPPLSPTCRPYEEIFVQINPPVVANSSNDTSLCLGYSTMISASATGGTGIYTFVWDNGLPNGQNLTVTPTTTTTYNVTITDTGGNCTATESVTVTIFPQPVVDAGIDQSACQGQSVTFTASASSGVPTYNFAWSNGANTAAQTFNATATSSYTVTVTDANSCTATDNLLLTVFDISMAQPNQTICLGGNTTLAVTINSGTASTYAWSNGATSPNITVSPATAGSHDYTVTVTDVNGCTDVASVTVFVNALPTADAGIDVEICLTFFTTLTASGGMNYLWSDGMISASTSVIPTTTTSYTVTVTDGNGCTDTDEVVITVNPLPTVNTGLDQNICLNTNATITAIASGGTGTLVYAWDNGLPSQTSHIVSPTVTTVYHVTVTDDEGCIFTDNVEVSLLDPLSVSVNSQVVCLGNSAMITATVTNGDGNNSYVWDNGLPNQASHTLTNAAGNTVYNVTVTDGLGCTGVANGSITVNPLPAANTGLDQSICSGQSATLTATGGGSYLWSTLETSATITVTPTATANYTVTVTNGNGCTNTDEVVVTVNPLPTANTGIDQSICAGQSATLTATGGGSYLWSTLETSATITVTPTATANYTVTVTNGNGCTNTDEVVVTVNPLPTANTGSDQSICAGQSATLTATGGGSYLWSTLETSATITVTPTATANYTVTVTNGNGCTNTDEVVVTVNPLPTANTGSDQSICAGQSATLTATGGSSYLWSTLETSATITVTPTATATYIVTVTDGNGCTSSDSVAVNTLSTAITSATASVCSSLTSNYSLTVIVAYAHAPSGNITVTTSNGATVSVAQTGSPQVIILTGLSSNGIADIDVTATFDTQGCTATLLDAYDAPVSCYCPIPNCGTATLIKN